jgi:tetratricopeptide (TPR) repeat protein
MTAPAAVERLKRRVQAGQDAFAAGRLEEALAEWSSALRSAQRLPVSETLRTALRNNLAGLYHSLGDMQRARRLYRITLAQAEKEHGTESAAVATLLNNVAELERSGGNPAAAEPLFRRALSILERHTPQAGPLVSLLANTAECLRQVGKIEEASQLSSRALSLAEASPELGPAALGVLLNNAAGIEERRDNFARASALYERAIKLLTDAGASHDVQRRQALRNHAAALRRYAAALERAAAE